MPTGFDATEFGTYEEHGALVTAIGASLTGADDPYLMLQRKLLYEEEDRRLGMDKPYLEYCRQGWSWYGHIVRFSLLRDRIRVQMDQSAAARMGNDGKIEVNLKLSNEQFEVLRGALHATFKDCPCFADGA